MGPGHKLKHRFQKIFSIKEALPVVVFLIIVYLLSLTWPIWIEVWLRIKAIFMPFVIGFILAYLLRPIVLFFDRYNIPRIISVAITVLVAVLILYLLFASILPSMFNDLSQFIESISISIQQIFERYKLSQELNTSLFDSMYQQVMDSMNALLGSLSNLPLIASAFISKTLSMLTSTMFSVVIAIYFIIDYEKISHNFLTLAYSISPKLHASILVIDDSVSSYLKSFFIIMPIIAVEYSLMYFVLGHHYALILGVLTAISLLIPYIGPMLVHGIGIVTALSIPDVKVWLLIMALMVLSNIDGYVISPLVYSKRNKVEPLWSLFSFFAASTLFGFVGVLISMPLYISIRSIFELRDFSWSFEKWKEVKYK